MTDDRPCTCPPMERPHPCARKFALSECKAATMMDPICYRWRHQKDEVWKYGHQPQHLVPPRGKELIGYYIVQPLYAADAIEALLAEKSALRERLSQLREDAERQAICIELLRSARGSAAKERDAALVDARRYRFLRDEIVPEDLKYDLWEKLDSSEWDAAIDAAMQEGGNEA